MVLHGWMTEAMKMVRITDNIVKLSKSNKETWITKLTACNESLGKVQIGRGIFQQDSILSLLFVDVLIPLSIIFSKTDLG